MIEKRERFRTRTIFLPGRSTFIFLWLFLVEPNVKHTHSLKSTFPHGIVSVPPPHSGSSVVKCPYSFLTAAIMNSIINLFLSRNKFPINSPFWSLIEKKLNKTNQPNKQTKNQSLVVQTKPYFSSWGVFVLFYGTRMVSNTLNCLPTALVREEFQIGIQYWNTLTI